MPGRRGARAGRGWDAIPPRPADNDDDLSDGEPRRDETERGNVPARRRRGSPGAGSAFGAPIGGSGTERSRGRSANTTFGGSGTERTTGRRRAPAELSDQALGSERASDGAATGFGEGDSAPGAGRGRRSSAFGREGPGSGFGADGSQSGLARDGARAGFGRGGFGAAPPPPVQSEAERAREICLRQLAVRPRTRAELAKVLARKEISEEGIAEVLDRYDEVGIIDDAAFARAWVSTRHQGRGLARRALANELRQRGVDAEVASEALAAVDDDAEAATARTLVDRKLRTSTGTPEAIFRRLVGMLARKGYPAGVAYRVVKDALAARDAEAAEFADQIDADALAEEQ
jgi:regulatory protein